MIFQKVNKEKTLFKAIDINEIVYLKGKKGSASVEVNITFGSGSSIRTNLSYDQFDELFEKFEKANADFIATNFPFPKPGPITKVSESIPKESVIEETTTAGDPDLNKPTATIETLLDEAIATTETKTKGGKEKGKEAKG